MKPTENINKHIWNTETTNDTNEQQKRRQKTDSTNIKQYKWKTETTNDTTGQQKRTTNVTNGNNNNIPQYDTRCNE